MSVCDELYEKLKQLGCTPKSGTALRNARGTHQGVSGNTLKKCGEEWLDQGKAEPCGECPCEGIRATQRNNPHPKVDVLPFPFRFANALVNTLDRELKAVNEALMHKPIRTRLKSRLKTRSTIVLKKPFLAKVDDADDVAERAKRTFEEKLSYVRGMCHG